MSVLLALTTDLDAGSPAGRLYGESLANALAVYLLSRYAVQAPRADSAQEEGFLISVEARA
jgi:AraC family transcriptional regulator